MIIDLFSPKDENDKQTVTSDAFTQPEGSAALTNTHTATFFSTNHYEFTDNHPKQPDVPITCNLVERAVTREQKIKDRQQHKHNNSLKYTVIKPTIPFYLQPDYKRKKTVDGKLVYRTDIPKSTHPTDRWNILVEIEDYVQFDRNLGCPIIKLKKAEPTKSLTERPSYKRKENGIYYLPAFIPNDKNSITNELSPKVARIDRDTDNAKAIHPYDEMMPEMPGTKHCEMSSNTSKILDTIMSPSKRQNRIVPQVVDDREEDVQTIYIQDEQARYTLLAALDLMIDQINVHAANDKIKDLRVVSKW